MPSGDLTGDQARERSAVGRAGLLAVARATTPTRTATAHMPYGVLVALAFTALAP